MILCKSSASVTLSQAWMSSADRIRLGTVMKMTPGTAFEGATAQRIHSTCRLILTKILNYKKNFSIGRVLYYPTFNTHI